MKETFFYLNFLFFLNFIFAQNDSVINKLLLPVIIEKYIVNNSVSPVNVIQREAINILPISSFSDAIKFLPGVTVKDWGGVGGLKTVAVRGFGSQHITVASDGMPVMDAQTGQIDLGKLNLTFSENISLVKGQGDDMFLPATLLMASSLLLANNRAPQIEGELPIKIIFNLSTGSFQLINPSLLVENIWLKINEKHKLSLSSSMQLNYMSAKGDYPYILHYGGNNDSSSNEIRKNTEVEQLSGEANFFFEFKKQAKLNAKFTFYNSERALPGATVFYSTPSEERLWDNQYSASLHYKDVFSSKLFYQFNIKYNYSYQRFLNPNYYNFEGKIDNSYTQNYYFLSNAIKYIALKILTFTVANDLIYNDLKSNLVNFYLPRRFVVCSDVTASLNYKFLNSNIGLVHQYTINKIIKTLTIDNNADNSFSPFAGISFKLLKKEDFYFRVMYKQSYRQPTFNDLYFDVAGARNLKPERAQQFNVGLNYASTLLEKKICLNFVFDGYFNMISDKIVTFPSQNLFRWSVLNYGKVYITGADITLNFDYKATKKVALQLSAVYTYQRAVDKTDPKGKTYNHQIPYTPFNSGSVIIAVTTKWIDLGYTIIALGKRYYRPQNSEAVLLNPYCDNSISLHKQLFFDKFNINLKFEVNNFTNELYEIIKNYPMQGRSYRFTVSFII